MVLRVRGPSGQLTLSGIDENTPIHDFLQHLAEKTGVPVGSQELLKGFPPRLIALPADCDSGVLGSIGIQAGDSITVRQCSVSQLHHVSNSEAAISIKNEHQSQLDTVAGMSEDEQLARAIAASLSDAETFDVPQTSHSAAAAAPPPPLVKGEPAFEPLLDGSAVVRRLVPDDNSCLFSAVGYTMQGSRKGAAGLRAIAAAEVLSDPIEWNEAVLGKSPAEYAKWIKDPLRWGGAIELSIFSKKFRMEIAACDVQTKRVDIYGQGQGYPKRVMLIYDGLHYDALAVASRVNAPESGDTAVFPSHGSRTDEIMAGASRLMTRFHEAGQFTDTANFSLRCGICKMALRGEREAVMHANETGHQNFTEY